MPPPDISEASQNATVIYGADGAHTVIEFRLLAARRLGAQDERPSGRRHKATGDIYRILICRL